MTAPISIARALSDRRLLGAALGNIATWTVWLIVLKAAFGNELTDAELKIFHSVAGDRVPPKQRARELWAVVGRRGGKSRIAAALAIYLACFVTYKLAPGEIGMVLVLAASQEQAKVVFGYAKAFLTTSPALRKEISETTNNEIRLKSGIIIAIHTNSFRTIRGRTLLACVFDEISFWRDETSATPDTEVYTAVLPGLATTNGMLIGISTPYRKLGLLHAKHRASFGKDDDDVLVVQGSSRQFNPSDNLSDAVIAAKRAADPTGAASEWDAEFRRDISAFLDEATIEAAIDHNRPLELPPRVDRTYRCFIDASGGRSDHYVAAVGNVRNGRYVIDCVRGHAPKFDPGYATKELADLVKQYRCWSVTGDSYAAEWVEAAWRHNDLVYEQSEMVKSELYLEALPLFTRGLVSMPDHPRLVNELRLLERRVHPSGRDTVEHPRNGHDDYSNAVAGLLRYLVRYGADYLDSPAWNDNAPPDTEPKQWQHDRKENEATQYMSDLHSYIAGLRFTGQI